MVILVANCISYDGHMSVLPIYTYGAPVLRKKARPVKQVTDEIVKLVVDMFETMHKANGIGLAANQVGSPVRVIVIDVSEMEEMKDVKPLTLINPQIVHQTGMWVMEEGCLSIPEVRDDVERAESITLRYKDSNFHDLELEVGGMLARVILHEIDHLNGVLFIDHLSPEKKKIHADRLKQIQRGEMEVSYPVTTAVDVTV
ncbi:MAG: peptide deformylase [Ignavibacteria bacterium]|nr:peptide deformylase [Ignavibacteria bacterium]MBI3766515.1 peptide deformylase [Ignavibacteriales bacterium]